MKYTLCASLVATVVVTVCGGCCGAVDTKPPAQFFTTLRSEWRKDNPPQMHSFASDDEVLVNVGGHEGQRVTVDITNTQTNELAYTETIRVEKGKIHAIVPGALAGGTYLAELSIHGEVVETWEFRVKGTVATGSVRKFYATIQSRWTEASPPRLESFGPGDVVTLYVYGYDGETVTVVIRDMLTGKLVETRSDYIARDRTGGMHYPDLGSGSYLAHLSINGTIVDTWKFTVKR